jgi:hypothetical protein
VHLFDRSRRSLVWAGVAKAEVEETTKKKIEQLNNVMAPTSCGYRQGPGGSRAVRGNGYSSASNRFRHSAVAEDTGLRGYENYWPGPMITLATPFRSGRTVI